MCVAGHKTVKLSCVFLFKLNQYEGDRKWWFVCFTVSTVYLQNSVVITETHGWSGGCCVYQGSLNSYFLFVCPAPFCGEATKQIWAQVFTNCMATKLLGHRFRHRVFLKQSWNWSWQQSRLRHYGSNQICCCENVTQHVDLNIKLQWGKVTTSTRESLPDDRGRLKLPIHFQYLS